MYNDKNNNADEIRFHIRLSFHSCRIAQDCEPLTKAIEAADHPLIVASAKTLQHDTNVGLRELRGMKVSPISKITQTDIVYSFELVRDGIKHLLEATQAEKRGQMDKFEKHIAQWNENIIKATAISARITENINAYQVSLQAVPEVKA